MPGATIGDFWPCVVIDEASFDFRNVPDPDVESSLEQFNDALGALRRGGQQPAVCSFYDSVECRDGIELWELLHTQATNVDPDVRRLTGMLLDKCQAWDDDAPDGCAPVDFPETPIPAFSVGYALTMGLSGRAVGCLVVSTCQRQGSLTLSNGSGSAALVFFAEANEVHLAWRNALVLEAVPEHEFFVVAAFAFPSLVFHPDLRFGKFSGSYTAVRDPVVRILGALNDHFSRLLAEHQGLPHAVAAAMGQYGVDLSPESPKTRASDAFMRQRYVTYDECQYCCEWHAKIERHRNRIHFTLPAGGPAGRILIGIFAEHLDV